MRDISRRLNKIEESLGTKNMIVIIHSRYEIDSDAEKQKEEYFSKFGKNSNVTFLLVKDYAQIEGETYDTFVKRMRMNRDVEFVTFPNALA